MQSMISSPVPTRAEVADIANAVLDGTDAVMLSAEAATGSYPLEAVRRMAAIIVETQSDPSKIRRPTEAFVLTADDRPEDVHTPALAQAAVMAAHSCQAKALLCLSRSGSTARQVSRLKPHCALIVVSPEPVVLRRLVLRFGVQPLLVSEFDNTDAGMVAIEQTVQAAGILNDRDVVVFCSGYAERFAALSNVVRLYAFGHAIRAFTARDRWRRATRAVIDSASSSKASLSL